MLLANRLISGGGEGLPTVNIILDNYDYFGVYSSSSDNSNPFIELNTDGLFYIQNFGSPTTRAWVEDRSNFPLLARHYEVKVTQTVPSSILETTTGSLSAGSAPVGVWVPITENLTWTLVSPRTCSFEGSVQIRQRSKPSNEDQAGFILHKD